MTRIVFLLVACLVHSYCVSGEQITFAFKDGNETVRQFNGLIERPHADADTGYSVLLIGGGYGWDLHWTVPGSYESEGQIVKLTIDGRPTRDADLIASTLVNAGYTTCRFSSIFIGDPVHEASQSAWTPIGVSDSVALTSRAIEVFRENGGFEPGRLVILGHSLGAARASLAAPQEDTAGLILLAGAYVSKTIHRPGTLASDALRRAGVRDGETLITEDDFMGNADVFQRVDADKDGVLRGWELAAWDRSQRVIEIEAEKPTWTDTLNWPSDRIIELDKPTLALFGGLDPISVHGPWLEALARDGKLNACTVQYLANMGHNLGPESDDLIGPISKQALESIVDWLRALPND